MYVHINNYKYGYSTVGLTAIAHLISIKSIRNATIRVNISTELCVCLVMYVRINNYKYGYSTVGLTAIAHLISIKSIRDATIRVIAILQYVTRFGIRTYVQVSCLKTCY